MHLNGMVGDEVERAAEETADDRGFGCREGAKVEADHALASEPEGIAADLLVVGLSGIAYCQQPPAETEQVDAGGAGGAADRVGDDVELVGGLLSEVLAQPHLVISKIEGCLALLLAADDADDSSGSEVLGDLAKLGSEPSGGRLDEDALTLGEAGDELEGDERGRGVRGHRSGLGDAKALRKRSDEMSVRDGNLSVGTAAVDGQCCDVLTDGESFRALTQRTDLSRCLDARHPRHRKVGNQSFGEQGFNVVRARETDVERDLARRGSGLSYVAVLQSARSFVAGDLNCLHSQSPISASSMSTVLYQASAIGLLAGGERMKRRKLGSTGRVVTALGLGCMGMSWGYNESGRDDRESEAAIVAAVDAGVDFFDTARIYGDGHNERLVGRALAGRRNVVIATKGGIVVDDLEARTMHRDGSPEALRRQIDESLRNLGRDVLDLYYLHRVDPDVPLEESWGALAEAVKAGKVRWLGLSEVTVDQASRAQNIHPVTAIQSELSLWTRDALGEGLSARSARFAGGADQASGDVVAWARDRGASIVPFAPLGRGFLTNTLRPSEFEEGDFRKTNPRFAPEAFERNSAITGTVQEIARTHGATAAQVALAWVLDLGEHVIPIPGTRRSAHLAENLAAMEVNLGTSERTRLDDVPAAVGSRY